MSPVTGSSLLGVEVGERVEVSRKVRPPPGARWRIPRPQAWVGVAGWAPTG